MSNITTQSMRAAFQERPNLLHNFHTHCATVLQSPLDHRPSRKVSHTGTEGKWHTCHLLCWQQWSAGNLTFPRPRRAMSTISFDNTADEECTHVIRESCTLTDVSSQMVQIGKEQLQQNDNRGRMDQTSHTFDILDFSGAN